MIRTRRAVVVFAVAAGLLTAGQAAISSAGASVTLGQVSISPSGSCFGVDYAQLSVAAGASYQVPADGTITSWSTNAGGASGQMLAMKVLRNVGPSFYKVIGLDGPRLLTANLLNNFPVSIPVQTGDILDLSATTAGPLCLFAGAPSDTTLAHSPGFLNNGDAAGFSSFPGSRLNLSAVFAPTNTVTLGTTALNKKKGTATLNLTIPNPGQLTVSGDGVAAAAGSALATPVAAGPVQVSIRATGKKKKRLQDKHKVTLSVTIAYTPANGDPGTQTLQVKLQKKH
ncbi:MAG: hypothetical protein QOD60_1021 [Solirubrobacterales bacterium]|jgi:hypothetical protein|nr:hypothetical protein [Solirubrobacterales bacterium]